MGRIVYLLPLLLFVVLAGYFAATLESGRDVHELPSAMIAKPAPAFDLASLNETQKFTLAGLKGRPVVINFFASWCVPCRVEHPVLMRLRAENHVAIYGIAYEDKPGDSSRLLATFGDPYAQVGIDRSGNVGLDFGVYGVPETYVIRGDGTIAYKLIGGVTGATAGPLMAAIADAARAP